MKKSKYPKRESSLVSSSLILCAGCISYVIWNQWLFLIGGLIGFTLIFLLKE
ncbi:hypothetical protein [Senegalia massiliensis]|uniref:hypothetical protein n=1 Tax=Senegalia massiliensis TaxID=1720316 RepID=UPI0013EEEFED|nr:hypothetical protein [Senegalia massiliensis]